MGEIIDVLCDAPAVHAIGKREAEAEAEADAEADAQYLAGLPYAAAPIAAAPVAAIAPVAHAVANSVTTNVKLVPVEVEHCHTVTKVACTDVENKIPKTTCEAVETTHVAHAVAPALGYAAYGRK